MTPSVPQRSYVTERQINILKILRDRVASNPWISTDGVRHELAWLEDRLISPSRSIKQLRDLEKKNLITRRRIGNNTTWSITDVGLEALRENT
jgi:DNA-binding PadR family transcriptional regulator